MYKYIPFIIILLFPIDAIFGQGFAWGPKGGLSLGQQSSQGYNRDILTAFHGLLYIESLAEEDKYALFAALGYHQRGSAIRTPAFTNMNGTRIQARSRKSTFSNAVLQLGGKQKFYLAPFTKWYFGVAIRGEYNLSVDLPDDIFTQGTEDLTTKFVYGATASVGLEHMFSDLIGAVVEFNVHPDFSDQIILPAQPDPTNPNRIIPESRTRNVTYEITLGLRLLRRVIYVD